MDEQFFINICFKVFIWWRNNIVIMTRSQCPFFLQNLGDSMTCSYLAQYIYIYKHSYTKGRTLPVFWHAATWNHIVFYVYYTHYTLIVYRSNKQTHHYQLLEHASFIIIFFRSLLARLLLTKNSQSYLA